MNSLKISNVNNNITFESTKNLVKAITSPTKRNALLPLITTGVGVGMTGIAYQTLKSDKYDKNANKYNEKEKKYFMNIIHSRFMNAALLLEHQLQKEALKL